jgi:iron-sulfur cluster assembly protein
VISLTERAVKELRRIVNDQHLPEGTVLRVGVKGGGCSGFSYSLGFDDTVHEDDPKSFLYLSGTQVDFEESLMGRGFKFGNPNATKSCGCGESFSV